MLDNFAANAAHDPILWNAGMEPYSTVGPFASSNDPCIRVDAFKERFGIALSYIVTWKMSDAMTDSCTNDVRVQLASHYHQVAASPLGDARLYQLND